MENVANRAAGDPPAGGCNGRCIALGHGAVSGDRQLAHDAFFRQFEAASALPVIRMVETLVCATGSSDEWSVEGGTPHPIELVDFVSAHNWLQPTLASRLSIAITDLYVSLRIRGQADGLLRQERSQSRCRRPQN